MHCIPDDIKVNVTGKAELSPKNERGHSYLKLVEIKFKGFIGDARGRLVDTTNNPDNKIFGEYQTPRMMFNNNIENIFYIIDIFDRVLILVLNSKTFYYKC